MIARYLLPGLALALCAALGWAWWQSGAIDRLRDDNARLVRNAAVLDDSLMQARLAAQKAAARAREAQEMTAKANATIEAIRNIDLGDCADETLDSALADLLGGGVPADD